MCGGSLRRPAGRDQGRAVAVHERDEVEHHHERLAAAADPRDVARVPPPADLGRPLHLGPVELGHLDHPVGHEAHPKRPARHRHVEQDDPRRRVRATGGRPSLVRRSTTG